MTSHHNGVNKDRVPTIFYTNCFHVSTPFHLYNFFGYCYYVHSMEKQTKAQRERLRKLAKVTELVNGRSRI